MQGLLGRKNPAPKRAGTKEYPILNNQYPTLNRRHCRELEQVILIL
jgi:hypothetical protein